MSPYYSDHPGEQSVIFTRVENGTPFLENGFRLIVGTDGEIVNYSREWYEGALPDAKEVIALEQADKLLAEKAKPSIVYSRMDRLTGDYDSGNKYYETTLVI